jgi:hypothetical protein
LELLFSASRSRGLVIVGIIQSLSQLQKNYGREGADIIVDNVQDTIFGGFAPGSETAEHLSKALGSRTVLSGSVNKGIKQGSENLQMMQRPLLTPDELKSLLTHDRGRTLRIILDAMGGLGYFCEWQRINSAAYLPQSRPRIYIVGHHGAPPAYPVFPIIPQDAEPRLILAGNLNIEGLFISANRVYSPDGISPCLDTSSDRPNIILPDGRIRHLTALEKWRLQGFTDDVFYKAAAVCSDAQLQKQAGNSVSVPVVFEIAKRFK